MTSVPDQFCLDGHVAIVTGASSGPGAGFGRALAQAGADLVLLARRDDNLAGTRRPVEAENRCDLTVRADISNPGDRAAVATAAMNQFGRIDVLANINLNGCCWMAQTCGRVMRPGRPIINLSSILGLTSLGLPQAACSASNALIGLTRDLAQQRTS
jgi:NAD(P)-dependent dehydrogenase (short-subunit alcohol dehydrogenase family)